MVPTTSVDFKKPDEVLDDIGGNNGRILLAIGSCALMWVIGAMQLMTSAFTTIDCKNCTTVTLVQEFSLKGDRAYLATWSSSSFMFGNMVGGAVLTHAADRFGRRPVLLFCIGMEAVLALSASLSPTIYVYIGLRFLHGVVYIAAAMVAWVAGYEHTPTAFRPITTLIFGLSWVVGYCSVTPIAVTASSWREIVRNCAIPMVLLFGVHLCFMPETLHFLVKKNKREEVERWLEKVDNRRIGDLDALFCNQIKDVESESKPSPLKVFFSNKKFILYFLIQAYLWTCDVFIYFGLSLYSTHLAGNMYINYLLMGLIEIPAYIFTPIALERFGRRRVVAITHLVAAASFLANVLNLGTWYTLGYWLVGKMCICSSFMALFVFASELFPTSIRNMSVGLCSVLSRVGGIVSPHIASLAHVLLLLPPFVLSFMSAVAGILTFCLPETHKKPLPTDVIED